MSDDDELPVLTQVLVTASGRAPSALEARAHAVAAVLDRRREPVFPRSLVIGNEPDSVGPGGGAAPAAFAPRRPTLRDLFSSTVPNGDDHATSGQAVDSDDSDDSLSAMNEPPIDQRPAVRLSGLDDEGGGVATLTPFPRALSIAVRDEVLEQLAARIDTELDARIAQTIRVELDAAIAQLQTRLRSELSEALRDVVGNAVGEALARRRRSGEPGDGDAGPR